VKISAIFVNFRYEIFGKMKINFRENAKTKIFGATLAKTVKWGEGAQQGV
jgi:hypothetical protein